MIQLFRVVISEQIIDNSEPVKCKRRTTLGKSLLFSRVLYREWWPATYCSRVSGYRDILPELDLVLWLIKADDRALSVDEYF
ncbi:GTPase family protein, partial [Escherichia coli]